MGVYWHNQHDGNAGGVTPLAGKWSAARAPAVSSAGALAYSQETGNYRHWQLLAQAGPQSPMRALATSDNPAYPVWGPDDQLAFINPDGTISIYNAGAARLVTRITTTKNIRGLGDLPHALIWGPGDPIAVADGGKAVLIDPATGHVTALPDGYWPLAWSPDGSHRLLVTGPDRHRLYLIPAAAPAAVQQVRGSTAQQIQAAAWTMNPPHFGNQVTTINLEHPQQPR